MSKLEDINAAICELAILSNSKLKFAIRDRQTTPNKQNPPLPADPNTNASVPFATVNILSVRSEGWAERAIVPIEGEDEDATELTENRIKIFTSINWFKKDESIDLWPLDEAMKFRAYIETRTAIDFCESNDLGFVRMSEARNITELDPTENYEQRAQVDAQFYSTISTSELIPIIKEARVVGELQEGNITYPIVFDIDLIN